MGFEHWLAIGIGAACGLLGLVGAWHWRRWLWPEPTLVDADEGPNLLSERSEVEQKYDRFNKTGAA